MEHFVLVPVSVCNNKYLNSRLVKKQELPKYQAEQITSYQIDWLKLETTENIQKAGSQSRLFSRQSFVFSSYQALQFEESIAGWRGNYSFTVRFWTTTSSSNRRRSG